MDKETSKIIIFVLGAILIFTAGIFLGQFLSQKAVSPQSRVEKSPTPRPPSPPTPPAKSIEEAGGVGSLPPKGEKDAPVTIIEFTDYQCPFSRRFAKEVLPQIEKNYIQTGKVKFYFRDFPLSFHQYAQKAALAARCANEQGKFWEYHDKIFQNQQNLNEENLKKWAKELDLDLDKFNQCLEEEKYKKEVEKDFANGQSAGVRGTPTFFVNGKIIRGAQPYDQFKKAIDEALAKNK